MHTILAVELLAYYVNTLIIFRFHPGPPRTIYHSLLG
jgi:hypothetical protein